MVLFIVLRRILSYKRRMPLSFSLLDINEKTCLKKFLCIYTILCDVLGYFSRYFIDYFSIFMKDRATTSPKMFILLHLEWKLRHCFIALILLTIECFVIYIEAEHIRYLISFKWSCFDITLLVVGENP
jgi:hypothetical protein